MDRDTAIRKLADYYGIEIFYDEDGKIDLDSYDWKSGCYCGREWLSLKNVVNCLFS